MALFWLINSVVIGSERRISGESINDALDNVTALRAAGALLWPQGDPIIDAAAARALSAKINRGANEIELEAIMQTAVQAVQLNSDGSEVWAQQPYWAINALVGNDANVGTSDALPLKTWGALKRKLGKGSLLRGTVVATPFSHEQIQVNFLSDLPDTDPIDFDIGLPPNSLLALTGVVKLIRSGTISAVTALVRSTSQAWEITDGVIDWTADIGRRIRVTAGPNIGMIGWIARNVGGGVAEVGAPNNPDIASPNSLVSFLPTAGVFSIGDAYVIEEMTNVTRGSTKVDSLFTGAGMFPTVGYMNLNFKVSTVGASKSFPGRLGACNENYKSCRFEGTVSSAGTSGTTAYTNCFFTSPNAGVPAVRGRDGNTFLLGGVSLRQILSSDGALLIDYDFLVRCTGGPAAVNADSGAIVVGTCGAYGSAQDGFRVSLVGGSLLFLAVFTGVAFAYGSGNTGAGLNQFAGSAAGKSATATLSVTGTAGNFLIGTATSTRGWDEAGSAYTALIANTWANFAAALPGGMAGNAHNVERNTSFVTF